VFEGLISSLDLIDGEVRGIPGRGGRNFSRRLNFLELNCLEG